VKFHLVRRSSQAVLLTLALTLPSVLCAQGSLETASLTLPEEPKPQGQLAFVEDLGTGSSSSLQSIDQASPAPSKPPMTDAERKSASEAELQRELHQRIGGVVPNFNAVLDGSSVPLTPGQKMRASFRSAVDPYQFLLAGISSAIGQANHSHAAYGEGMEGYGKRFGASFTDQFNGTILGNGVFPSLFHQDARYFRMGTGSVGKRLLYSVGTTVRCKGDNGKWQPSYSNLLGNLAAGGISNLYYPAADRGLELTIQQGLTVTAEGAIGALLIEFYPDIRKHFHGKRRSPDPTIENRSASSAKATH
jgi:hypothetical protein